MATTARSMLRFALVAALVALALPAWARPLRVVIAPSVDVNAKSSPAILARAEARLGERLAESGRFVVIQAAGTPAALALVADAIAHVEIEGDGSERHLRILVRALPSLASRANADVVFHRDGNDDEAALLHAIDAAAQRLDPEARPPLPASPPSPAPAPSPPPPPSAPPTQKRAEPPSPPPRRDPRVSVIAEVGIHNRAEIFGGVFQLGLGSNEAGLFSGALQLGLRRNAAGRFSGGVQLSPGLNEARDFNGLLQIGLVNVTESLFGAGQIGIYNRVERARPELSRLPGSEEESHPGEPWREGPLGFGGLVQIGVVNVVIRDAWMLAQVGVVNWVARASFSGLLQIGPWSSVTDGDARGLGQVGLVAFSGRAFAGLVQAGVVAVDWQAFRGLVQISAFSYVGSGLLREVGLPRPDSGAKGPRSFQGLAQIGGLAATDGDFDGGIQLALLAGVNGDFHGGLEIGAVNYVEREFFGFAQIGAANVVHRGFTGALRLGAVNVASDAASIYTDHPERLRMRGADLGVANVALSGVDGVQIGVVNVGVEVRGVQIGAFNWCRRLRGAQLGVINVCAKALVPVMPIVNMGW